MKRILIACATAAGLALAATGAQAQHGGGGMGGGGAYHGGGGGGGNWHGGGGGNWHGGNWHGGWHGGHFHGSSVFIGGVWWPYYYGYPYPYYGYSYPAYSYYDYPSYGYYGYPDQGYGDQTYVEPGPSTQQAPMQQAPTQFYCPNTGYYPTVKTCPQGWLRVVPDNAPPQ